MNKRMREPFHALIWKASVGYNDSWSQVNPEVLEKFAELIVEECISVVEDQFWSDPHEVYEALDLIKKHFGVK